MTALEKTAAKMKKYGVPCEQNVTFRKLTTLGCGGKIYLTVYPETVRQLVRVAKYLHRKKVPHVFVGMGSNILASDVDFMGVAVVTRKVSGVHIAGQRAEVLCGTSTAALSDILTKNGLSGGEFFGCLPATVGGVTVCNAGCFGQSVRQVVESVTVLHNGRLKKLSAAQCRFSTRTSIFKNNGSYVVLKTVMRFPRAPIRHIKETLANMRKTKSATQPLNARSAGCVLYSEKTSVSRLIDQAGLKGFTIGGAAVSEKHAGFVINLDKAAATDIYLLIEYLKNTVHEKYGVLPETELCLVNFDKHDG